MWDRGPAVAAGPPMKPVGALNSRRDGQFSNVAADAFDTSPTWVRSTHQASPWIDTSDPANPVSVRSRPRTSRAMSWTPLRFRGPGIWWAGTWLRVIRRGGGERSLTGVSIYRHAAGPS